MNKKQTSVYSRQLTNKHGDKHSTFINATPPNMSPKPKHGQMSPLIPEQTDNAEESKPRRRKSKHQTDHLPTLHSSDYNTSSSAIRTHSDESSLPSVSTNESKYPLRRQSEKSDKEAQHTQRTRKERQNLPDSPTSLPQLSRSSPLATESELPSLYGQSNGNDINSSDISHKRHNRKQHSHEKGISEQTALDSPSLPPLPPSGNESEIESSYSAKQSELKSNLKYSSKSIKASDQTQPIEFQNLNYPTSYRDLPLTISVPTCGILNIGNTCYMNSALQCLAHLNPLTHLLSHPSFKFVTSPPSRPHSKFTASTLEQQYPRLLNLGLAVKEAVQALGSSTGLVGSSVAGKVHSSLGSLNKELRGFGQQDSHEALVACLNSIHETSIYTGINPPKTQPTSELKDNCIVFDSSQPPSEIGSKLEQVFQRYVLENGSIVSFSVLGLTGGVVRCNTCGNRSVSVQPFTVLSLTLPSSRSRECSVGSMLKGMSAVQRVNDFKCESCKAVRQVTHGMFVVHWPKVLLLHFNRFSSFSMASFRKDSTPVDIPLELSGEDIRSLFSSFEEDMKIPIPLPPATYRLVGTINHSGSMSGGHYTFTGLSGDSTWTRHSDSSVMGGSPPGRSAEAYLCAYVRQGVP
ncbi:putative Ubiquitin carboxyl-terminal hydrolase 4 [Blattamonas nauphoetae]|uniref:Ubiquitin carboxyl-terminal hydrolase n=1 Tax=Blattamonas nauphoetae TaxID=2049346 RepID=A0ABQ9XAP4_9EUKA|nr:putative Ubiquitin carboxyl-terminal hydrolase 4 [Blattamonas nauphoetae]